MKNEVYPPREDSFLLVQAIKEVKGKKCLDLGCGTGNIGLRMLELGADKVVFADVNPKALEETRKTVEAKGLLDKAEFVESDLFSSLPEKFEVIAFNPPYIESREAKILATDGGKKGREVLDRFFGEIGKHLEKNGGVIFLQSNLNGEQETMRMLESMGLTGKIIARKKLFFEELLIFEAKAKV